MTFCNLKPRVMYANTDINVAKRYPQHKLWKGYSLCHGIKKSVAYPAQTRRTYNAGMVLAQRHRSWFSINPTLSQRLTSHEIDSNYQTIFWLH